MYFQNKIDLSLCYIISHNLTNWHNQGIICCLQCANIWGGGGGGGGANTGENIILKAVSSK